jgi:hypothetical protein
MTIQKIKSGRITTIEADEYVGVIGTIFYNEEIGDLRLSDGITIGGIPINTGSGGGGGDATIIVSATAPTGVLTGTLWWNSVTGVLNIRYAGGWRIASTTPGPKGDTGDTGPAGANGTSIVIKGAVLTADLLPLTSEVGDLFVITSTGDGYFWNGTTWEFLGTIRGPKGDTGNTGETGSQGIQGIKGDTGATGPKGDTGSQGIQGIQGDIGSQGIQGIKGDTGATGPKGDTGSQGIQGIQGIKGDTGATGPKGDTGDTGDTGAQGIQGVKGDTGETGPQGIQGETGPQGLPGQDGVSVGAVRYDINNQNLSETEKQNAITNLGLTASPLTVIKTFNLLNEFTAPIQGTSIFVPIAATTITMVQLTVGQIQTADLLVALYKNNAFLSYFTVPTGEFTASYINLNYPITTLDFFTVNIVAGSSINLSMALIHS